MTRRATHVFGQSTVPVATPGTNRPVVGRLAPSPTGALHLGNARSFLLAWLSIRQQHGQLLLRIEDIDSPRIKPWALQATIEDLQWLGLDWDAGPDGFNSSGKGAATGPAFDSGQRAATIEYIQTRRLLRYQQVLDQLIADHRVYPCTCSRSEVARSASAPHESSPLFLEGPIYSGTCRLDERSGGPQGQLTLPPDKFAWRWRFAPGEKVWFDQLRGVMRAEPEEQLGDFVVARGDGTPAYQLAVVVDDYDMGVTEVVRGDDLIFSTYRQQAILEHLGWPVPNYVHVPLMVGPDGRRLAKRHGDTRLSTFRERGVTAEQIVGYLAWTLGLQEQPESLRAAELIGRLDWRTIPRQPTVVDSERLDTVIKQRD